MSMTLGELAACVPGARLVGSPDVPIARAVHDSRQVGPGDLFVALGGTRVDGHRFVPAALEAGAAAAVVERDLPLPGRPAQMVVPDSREALGRIAHALARFPTRRLTVCGVTGTNGKTTTTYLVRSIFEAAGRPCGLLGTIRYLIGERQIRSHMTTPDAAEMAGYFAEMADQGLAAAVLEVSSHALDQRRTAGIEFRVGAFTNLSPEHMDYHKDMPSYRQAKGRLFAGLSADAWAVLNADEEASHSFAKATKARVLWYGVGGRADVRAEGVRSDVDGSRFALVGPRGRAAVHTALLGLHNVYNALAAAGIAEAVGLPLEAVVRGVEAVRTVAGRLEPVPTNRPFAVLVDYAHKTDALRHALTTVRELVRPGRRLIVVFGCGGDRDREKRPDMAAVAEELADRVIVTSDNPRSEAPEAIAAEIMAGFQAPTAVTVELDRRTAIALAIAEAGPGDVVLIAGKGHETYQETAHGILDFDDRKVAGEILGTAGLAARP
jgi:UDP-N-acetylmuramoyl-L-alanyl-D-glutamate--2,6-diaminopimelate ligase